MAVGSPPTVRRRQLGRELRRLREAAGLHADQLAERLRCSPSRISRIETARIRITPGTVHEILDVLGVNGAERNRLVELARDAEQSGWWQAYADKFPSMLSAYLALESGASSIRSFEPLLVHGLLQTEAYARVVMEHRVESSEGIESRVAARLARQELLSSPDFQFWLIFDEAVLHRQVGGHDVMNEQLVWLVERGKQPNIRLQMIAFEAGLHSSMTGPFGILNFPDPTEPAVVYIESAATHAFLEREGALHAHEEVFARLSREALSKEETLERVSRMSDRSRTDRHRAGT
jgi:transcriptional regulator with XRE-family HTH domain